MTSERTIDPILLLVAILAVAAALTWVVPAGRFERRTDPRTGRTVVVPGSYHSVPRNPIGPWAVVNSIPQGLTEAAEVIFFVILTGGAITVVEATGALGNFLNQLICRLRGNYLLVLGLTTGLFIIGGASEGMYEEILALLPILCILVRRLGLGNEMALGISVGTASVAGAFSPVNTFLLGLGQTAAGLPLFSGFAFRSVMFVCAMAIWLGYLAWYAKRKRVVADSEPQPSLVAGQWRHRDAVVLLAMNGGMLINVLGGVFLGWGLGQFSAVFLAMAFVSGLSGGLGWRGTAERLAEGIRGMALAAVLIGFARAISVVLGNGLILDTIANTIFTPLRHFGLNISAVLMWIGECALAFPMPSDSGRAVMTLPVAIPVADLLGLSRQMVVAGYQYSSLFSNLVTPTAGALLAMFTVAKVPLSKWFRFVAVPIALLALLSAAAMVVGVRLGIQ